MLIDRQWLRFLTDPGALDCALVGAGQNEVAKLCRAAPVLALACLDALDVLRPGTPRVRYGSESERDAATHLQEVYDLLPITLRGALALAGVKEEAPHAD